MNTVGYFFVFVNKVFGCPKGRSKVKITSGIDRERVRAMTMTSHNIAAILQLIGHANLVYSVHHPFMAN